MRSITLNLAAGAPLQRYAGEDIKLPLDLNFLSGLGLIPIVL